MKFYVLQYRPDCYKWGFPQSCAGKYTFRQYEDTTDINSAVIFGPESAYNIEHAERVFPGKTPVEVTPSDWGSTMQRVVSGTASQLEVRLVRRAAGCHA